VTRRDRNRVAELRVTAPVPEAVGE
jgi:hypothetical protein